MITLNNQIIFLILFNQFAMTLTFDLITSKSKRSLFLPQGMCNPSNTCKDIFYDPKDISESAIF